ncbi:serine protease [Streptomyces longispororuber]|uniref:serine protease n=1 Tax=Streptomyces longispororuber TaxID=68230 RepID=UPI0033F10A38
MNEPQYWVDIWEDDRHLGAGFLVTRSFVLTAWHCLDGLSAHEALMNLRLPGGLRISGHLFAAVEEADLALVKTVDPHRHGLPLAPPTDVPRPHARWRGTYCPPGENARLSGRITHALVDHHSAAGGVFTAMQLAVDQKLGTYVGYSGSPVDTGHDDPDPQGEAQRLVVGILMEQQLSRQDDSPGSNVLFAASVRHAMERFAYFGVEYQKEMIPGPRKPEVESSPSEPGGQDSAQTLIGDTGKFLKALRDWERSGDITQEEARQHRGWALRGLIGKLQGREANG